MGLQLIFFQNGNKKKAAAGESPSNTEASRAASATPPPPVLEPENLEVRLIPRLVDTDGQTAIPRGNRDENLEPSSWTCEEVAQFLEINEIKCDPLVEAILEQVRRCIPRYLTCETISDTFLF